MILTLLIATLILILLVALTKLIISKNQKSNSSKKIKKRLKFNLATSKLAETYSNKLMIDPERNIKITEWDTEKELLEKADIHKTRLNKFGRSKMNNVVFFLDQDGIVYKVEPNGEKTYV